MALSKGFSDIRVDLKNIYDYFSGLLFFLTVRISFNIDGVSKQ